MLPLILITLLQSPLPLPSVPLPDGFLGGANIERLAIDLAGVIAGEMPDVPPPTVPLTGFGAQAVPTNPSEVAFASPDHAIITDYEIGFFLTGAAQPVQANKQAKPGLSTDGDVHLTFNSRPLGLGIYELKVRAYAGTEVGTWSGPVGFTRVLSGIGPVRIVR